MFIGQLGVGHPNLTLAPPLRDTGAIGLIAGRTTPVNKVQLIKYHTPNITPLEAILVEFQAA